VVAARLGDGAQIFVRESGLAMWPHLTPSEAVLVIKLYAVWLLPNWLLKVLAVAEAIRRYRR
jgi:hypothetical protein